MVDSTPPSCTMGYVKSDGRLSKADLTPSEPHASISDANGGMTCELYDKAVRLFGPSVPTDDHEAVYVWASQTDANAAYLAFATK